MEHKRNILKCLILFVLKIKKKIIPERESKQRKEHREGQADSTLSVEHDVGFHFRTLILN